MNLLLHKMVYFAPFSKLGLETTMVVPIYIIPRRERLQ